jgi:2,3-bisphosphoglycerate-independent phosphoglycerate mutase
MATESLPNRETSNDSPNDPVDSRTAELVKEYRKTKHHILNTLAIWNAQAQMTKSDANYYTKLVASILERSESLISAMSEFEEKLGKPLK